MLLWCPAHGLLACRLVWTALPRLLSSLLLLTVAGDSLTNEEERLPFSFKTKRQEPGYYNVIAHEYDYVKSHVTLQ